MAYEGQITRPTTSTPPPVHQQCASYGPADQFEKPVLLALVFKIVSEPAAQPDTNSLSPKSRHD
jgi:hypothetical protein